jgi:hypothetical protein
MGIGYGRKIAQVLARRARQHVGGSRQIHQVGRSSPGNYLGFYSSNQLHQIHSISLQSTTQHHHRQWDKCHVQRVQKLLRKYGNQIKVRICRTSKTNGQVEKANGLICNRIKMRLLAPLEKAKHAWVDELPSVL